MALDAVRRTRTLLQNVTPLAADCGRFCGAACCRPMEGEETGMILFPGEEEEYEGRAGWKLKETERGILLICDGKCRREERPLACRLFPLIPAAGKNGIRAVVDQRAVTVCPLARQGMRAMNPAFEDAVRRAGELIRRGYRDGIITCDSAEPKSVADYRSLGLNARAAVKGPDSVEYGMKWLQARTIVIDRRRTPEAYREFESYEFERDREGSFISGYPDRDNHLIDAVRYALEPVIGMKAARSVSRSGLGL